MALADMNVKIGADIADALTKINQLKQANIQLTEETGALSSAYKKNAEELRKLEQAQETGVGVTKKTAQQIKNLAAEQKILTASIVDNKEVLKQSTSVINNYEKSLTAVSSGSKKLSGAIERLTNVQDIAAKGVSKLEHLMTGALEGAAIGLAVTIGGIVVKAFVDWYEATNQVSEATKILQAQQSDLNDIMGAANKDAGKQIADLRVLYETATNVNLSMKDRLAAVEALQAEFPDFFANIKTENILNGDSKSLYDELTKSIKETSRAKAALSKLDAIEAEQLDNDFKKQKILIATQNEINAAIKHGNVVKSGEVGSGKFLFSVEGEIKAIEKRRDAALEDLKTNDIILEGRRKFVLGITGIAGAVEETQAAKIAAAKAAAAKKAEAAQKAAEAAEKKAQEEALKALDDNFKRVQELRIKELDANITDRSKNGAVVNEILLKDEVDYLQKKESLLNQFGRREGDTALKIAELKKKILLDELKFEAEQRIANIVSPNITDFSKLAKEKIDPFAGQAESIKEALLNIRLLTIDTAKYQAELDKTAKTVTDALAPAFDAMFTSIIDGTKNAFQAFGDMLVQLVKQIAVAVLKAAALAAILTIFFPGSTQAIGGFGATFNRLLKFAEGGEVKGPGTSKSDSIPARLSKGEYVIKADTVKQYGVPFFDRLNQGKPPSFINGIARFANGGFVSPSLFGSIGGGQAIQIFGRIEARGDKLVTIFERANRQINRNS